MSKYGKKFTCWSCATKFYDLGKAHPKCPKCGADPAADPNAGGGGPAEEADFPLEEEIEGAPFTDDEESEDVEDAEEAEPEEEDEGF